MKRPPARFDIFIAEHQLVQAKRESREHVARVRSALRSRLVQSSSLLAAAGLGALFGAWFAHRHKPRVNEAGVTPRARRSGLVSTYLSRFGMQRLAVAWMRLRHSDSVTK